MAVALFPLTPSSKKSSDCEEAWNPENLVNIATRKLKKKFPELIVMLDVALDPYNIDGHDGLLVDGEIINDETLVALERQALVQAESGADILGPSDMMDGRIKKIRVALEAKGFKDTLIMSYAAKFASAYYGPFREAVGAQGLLKGDKKTYQIDPPNMEEAIRLAEVEGYRPKEGWYVLLAACFSELKDRKIIGPEYALEQQVGIYEILVNYYPKKQYFLQLGGTYQQMDRQDDYMLTLKAAYDKDLLNKEGEYLALAQMLLLKKNRAPVVSLIHQTSRGLMSLQTCFFGPSTAPLIPDLFEASLFLSLRTFCVPAPHNTVCLVGRWRRWGGWRAGPPPMEGILYL